MSAASYGPAVTEDEEAELRGAQQAVHDAKAALDAAIEARDAILRRMYRPGVRDYGPTALARVVNMHRVTVAEIVTNPPKN